MSSIALLTALSLAASGEGAVSAELDGRSSWLAPEGLRTDNQLSSSVAPRGELRLELPPLRFEAAYAPRFWSNDLEQGSRWLTTHLVEARLGTEHEASWSAGIGAAAVRGSTDPAADVLGGGISDPGDPGAPGGGQLPTTGALRFEELHANGDAAIPFGRNRLGLEADWMFGRAVDPTERALLPPQRTLSVTTNLTRLVTERSSVRLSLLGTQAWTETAGGLTRSASTTGLLSWEYTLTPLLQTTLGAGATLTYDGSLLQPTDPDVLAAAEAGITRAGDDLSVTLSFNAQLTTAVDRFTGEVDGMAIATGSLTWQAGERVVVEASLSGGTRLDGATKLGRAETRVGWQMVEAVRFELGVVGRLQREERPEIPSFSEVVTFAGVSLEPAPLFRVGRGPQPEVEQ